MSSRAMSGSTAHASRMLLPSQHDSQLCELLLSNSSADGSSIAETRLQQFELLIERSSIGAQAYKQVVAALAESQLLATSSC